MNLLLDTQIVYWANYDLPRLPAEARRLISEADVIYVSAATLWEMTIKVKLGKLNVDPQRLMETFETSNSVELPILSKHGVAAGALPLHHADPFDRILIAQAISERLWFITTDRRLPQYTDRVILV